MRATTPGNVGVLRTGGSAVPDLIIERFGYRLCLPAD